MNASSDSAPLRLTGGAGIGAFAAIRSRSELPSDASSSDGVSGESGGRSAKAALGGFAGNAGFGFGFGFGRVSKPLSEDSPDGDGMNFFGGTAEAPVPGALREDGAF
jgi:hypothetical protein